MFLGRDISWTKLLRRVRNRLHLSVSRPPEFRRTLVIGGFQRSGTTILSDIFERDWRCRSYGEFRRVIKDGELRMPEIPDVENEMGRGSEHISVIKPLMDSHRLPQLLDGLPHARGIWLYREYPGSVRSNMVKFGEENADKLFSYLVETERPFWVNESESDATRDIISSLPLNDLSALDKLAMAWMARNRLYYELGLDQRDDVILLKYDDIVADPTHFVGVIYRHLGVDPPVSNIGSPINRKSAGKGSDDPYHPRVTDLCTRLQTKLDSERRQ